MRTAASVLFAVAAFIAAGAGWHAQPAAPKGKPALPEYDPVVVDGHWDGDGRYAPYLIADGPAGRVTWHLAWPSRAAQDADLGRIDPTMRVRVTGYVGTGAAVSYLFVVRLEAP